MTSRRSGQKWVMVGILAVLGTASAQGNSLPDETACAKIVAPHATPTSPAFTRAMQATVHTYAQHAQALLARLADHPPTGAELNALTTLSWEIDTFLARLLAVTGWPVDPGLRTEIEGVSASATLQGDWSAHDPRRAWGNLSVGSPRSISKKSYPSWPDGIASYPMAW